MGWTWRKLVDDDQILSLPAWLFAAWGCNTSLVASCQVAVSDRCSLLGTRSMYRKSTCMPGTRLGLLLEAAMHKGDHQLTADMISGLTSCSF